MRFWDSSAIVPLIVEEAGSATCRRLLRADPGIGVWALSSVEGCPRYGVGSEPVTWNTRGPYKPHGGSTRCLRIGSKLMASTPFAPGPSASWPCIHFEQPILFSSPQLWFSRRIARTGHS